MISCPCCSGLLLPHIRGSEIHWFCRHCWQDMPVFYRENPSSLVELMVSKFSRTFDPQESVTTDNQSLAISH
ncbi:MAG TPA: hypothetical protein IGS40_00060 [Trichormus sp. M33_DOE_039]|nr:hypothetical protein [Trichormus sp. M33_DOE_039]